MVKTRFLHRHSLCNIRWIIQSFLIEYLSLDDIMDDNNAHTCHTPIDPNQLAILENLLQDIGYGESYSTTVNCSTIVSC